MNRSIEPAGTLAGICAPTIRSERLWRRVSDVSTGGSPGTSPPDAVGGRRRRQVAGPLGARRQLDPALASGKHDPEPRLRRASAVVEQLQRRADRRPRRQSDVGRAGRPARPRPASLSGSERRVGRAGATGGGVNRAGGPARVAEANPPSIEPAAPWKEAETGVSPAHTREGRVTGAGTGRSRRGSRCRQGRAAGVLGPDVERGLRQRRVYRPACLRSREDGEGEGEHDDAHGPILARPLREPASARSAEVERGRRRLGVTSRAGRRARGRA